MLLLAGCAAQQTAPTTWTSPVLDTEFADPFVLPIDDGTLVAYATNHTADDGTRMHLPVSTSRDGQYWTTPVDAMPAAPPWARAERPDLWAPEVLQVGDHYIAYFSARHATRRRPDGLTLCLGAAISKTPTGPFVPQPAPLTCGGEHGVIDVSPFRDVDASGQEQLWLIYKTDGNCCGVPTTFVAQHLRADGLALIDAPQTMAGAVNDQPWEGHVVEAPQLLRHDGQLYLFFAGNDYGNGAYATGYARCDSPAGPCRDALENPILRSTDGPPPLIGPGHQHVFQFQGRSWIAYHGWRAATATHPRYRAMYVQPLDWRDGRPVPTR
ncbi:Glycosyl hydrolases family 43 [Pseudoxanthomonas sp. GM95]|uniref:glycoside hydrolase family 43 protein n=1 Tax=Pseudoxanthomonas sp. GM95 TaxID=1881043 RepID=UPI0008B62001|nr:glycoside hydrolase family 43 protein [Pseudoxanthomonas sp. GM95]SEL60309.1 Glycosyl hydrolases family 43 [Pseudoxanthomonas sp. GM95]